MSCTVGSSILFQDKKIHVVDPRSSSSVEVSTLFILIALFNKDYKCGNKYLIILCIVHMYASTCIYFIAKMKKKEYSFYS